MTPMPEEAKPIAKIIARDVERPRDLPVMLPRNDNDLEGAGRSLGWPAVPNDGREGVSACPLGLRERSYANRPASFAGADIDHNDPDAPACTLALEDDEDENHAAEKVDACEVQQAVEAFTEWWDDLGEDDAQEAVAAIWGVALCHEVKA